MSRKHISKIEKLQKKKKKKKKKLSFITCKAHLKMSSHLKNVTEPR